MAITIMFEIPAIGWIILLLLGIAISVWIAMRMLATQDWDFKEQSLKYLRGIERRSGNIPFPSQPDRELVEYKIASYSSQDAEVAPRFSAELLLDRSQPYESKAEPAHL